MTYRSLILTLCLGAGLSPVACLTDDNAPPTDMNSGGGTSESGAGGSNTGPEPIEEAGATPLIVVDQFGYRPVSEKIAVLRDPRTGFDAHQSYQPGSTLSVVDVATDTVVFEAAPEPWNGGEEDPSSGDVAYWFDFSSVTTPGNYLIRDSENEMDSFEFEIGEHVYREVLAQALRTFFYQRAGFEKRAPYADAGYEDGPSHLGPLQDANCRRYDAPDDESTERDLSGGWYDAGDYNKYTNWTAGYVVGLLNAYATSPEAFSDAIGLPESENGRPDILDEARYGIDWLRKMQNSDGSVLSIVGLGSGSPPSSAMAPSHYGTESTSATLSTAAALARAAVVFGATGDTEAAAELLERAEAAFDWAEANPAVTFYNNSEDAGTGGLGAGQQEVGEYDREMKRLCAAVSLFEATSADSYRELVDEGFRSAHLLQWGYAYPFEPEIQEALLRYASLPAATPATAASILSTYRSAMSGADNFGAHASEADPYLANLSDYVWGSNSTKCHQGNMFVDLVTYGADPTREAEALRVAERYLHYLHGLNPLGQVYLSNMGAFGAEKSVDQFYHSWFEDGSVDWDSVENSTYGPAPGFLVGGPNPTYTLDGCCPDSCGSTANNARCNAASLSPPLDQPAQKSYRDFNSGWPQNSWAVTENSNGYQVAYIRLLARFAR